MTDTSHRTSPLNDREQRAAGYHEASHAVMGIMLGATPGTLSLNCRYGTWIGEAPLTWNEGPGLARRKKIFQVAAAGPFGQAKHRACLQWRGVTFDQNDALHDVIEVIREADLKEESRITLGFVAGDGSPRIFEIKDLNDVGDFLQLQAIVQDLDNDHLRQLLGAVRDYLDAMRVWHAVGQLAERLCRDHRIAGDEVVAVAQQFGLVRGQ